MLLLFALLLGLITGLGGLVTEASFLGLSLAAAVGVALASAPRSR